MGNSSAVRLWMFLWVAGIFVVLAGTALAEAPRVDDEVEDVDVVETVEVVQTAPAGSHEDADAPPPGRLGFMQLVGRFHSAVVHLPIGFLLALLLLELTGVFSPAPGMDKAGRVMALATGLSFVPAVVSGFLRASELAARGAQVEPMTDHRNAILAAAAVTLGAVVLRMVSGQQMPARRRTVYLGILILAAGLLTYAAHLGGELVFGPDHFSV